MKNYYKLLILILLSFVSLSSEAQSVGDKLFAQGQKMQKTMTLAAQKKAIDFFTKAKTAYDSSQKKSMCDNQITVCNNIIKAAPWKRKTFHANTVAEIDTTELKLSTSALEFKAKGESNTITVNCNRNDWKVTSSCDWITYTCNGDNLTVTTSKNKEESSRTGVVSVKCGKVIAELQITQKASATLGKGLKNAAKYIGIK